MSGAPAVAEVTPKADAADATDALAVTDGSVHVGTIVERHGKHFAFDAAGKHVGTFATRTQAVRSIPQVRP
jgi:hypothetical protein